MNNVCSASHSATQLGRERLWQPTTPHCSTEHHADVSPAAGSARPSQEAREAWERYVQDQWGPMLKALGGSGKHASPGRDAGQGSLGQPVSTPAAAGFRSRGEQADAERAEEEQNAESAGNKQAPPQEDGVWASLAAHALQEASARTAEHAGPTPERLLLAADDAADSDSSEEIDIMGLPSTRTELEATFSSLCLKHPWDEQVFCSNHAQEPLTFSSVGVAPPQQHQRMRRVVRVVRAARPPASKASPGDSSSKAAVSEMPAGLKEALLSSPGSSSPEPSLGPRLGRHDPSQRTRKKRAAATLMEGTSTFHAPPAATGEIDCSTSSPPGCAQHLSKDGGPENAAAPQSMQPPPPVALPPGGAPVAQPGQNRLPHPMDPLPRLNMHACCSPALWAPPAAHMQHPAPPRYPYMMPASSIPMWTGPPGMKGMQEPPVPALQNTDSCRELEQKSGVKHAPTRIGAPAPPRPPLLLAAALGRTDVVQILLAGTDYCEPPQPFTDHRYTETHQALEEAAAAAAELARQATGHPARGAPFLSAPRAPGVPQELTLLHCTALHLAATYGHAQAVQALLTSPACSPAACNAMGTTALQAAAREGWVEVVAVLAGDSECQVNSMDIAGRSALHWAASYGHVAVVNELWCRSANVQQIDHGGCTALHYAADAGHSEVAGSLVIAGTLVSAYSAAGWTAMHLAAMKGHTLVIEKLLIGGYQVDCTSQYPNSGWTAAHVAARQGHLEALKRLIASGAKAQRKSETGSSVLQCAAESGSFPVFSHLLQMGVCDTRDADCFGTRLIHSAAQGGSCQIMEHLGKLGHSIDAIGHSGRSCLHYAARGMHLSMARWLLEHGADVNTPDGAGETPLMTAAGSAEPGLVELLLSQGADVAAQCKTGCTALHLAVAQGPLKTVEALMQAGSDPSTICLRGTSALHHAAEANRTENIAALLTHANGSLVQDTDEMGWTALHYAALHQLPESAALLIQAGANVDAQCDSGLTALHVACRGQAVLVATLLLAAGCDASLQDSRGCTALHYAAQTANWGLFSLLHAHPGCRFEPPGAKGASLLQYGAEGGSLDIVKLLLSELQLPSPSESSPDQLSSAGILDEDAATRAGVTASSQQAEKTEYDPEQTQSLVFSDSSGFWGGRESPGADVQSARARLSDGTIANSGVCNPVHIAALKGFSDLIPSLLGAGFSASAPDAYTRTPLHYAAMKGFVFFPAPSSDAQLPAAEPPSRPASGEQHSAHHGQVQSDTKPEGAGEQQQPSGGPAHAEEGLTPGYTPSCSGDSEHSYTSQSSPAPLATPKVAPGSTSVPLGGPPPFAQLYPGTGASPYGSFSALGVNAPHQYSAGLTPPAQYYGPRATVAYGLTGDLLIEAGADGDAIDVWGCSALHYAAGTGQMDLVDRLLDLEVECSQVDKNLWTPLTYAAAGGHANCVRALLEAGASAGDVDAYGRTALHWAAERGWADVVSLLVPAMALEGGDVGLLDKAGSSAAAVAAYGGQVECVARVLDSTAIASDRGMSALHLAVQGKMEALVAQLLTLPAAVATVNIGDKDGLTPLHWAATEGNLGMVEMLLNAGAEVDALTNDHWTPLHEAALNGHVEAVERLLRAGAQVALKTSVGLTPLHNAASNSHVRVMEALLCAGAAVNARAGSNATALFIAAQNGHLEAVQRLLESSAEPSVAAGAGATALHAAASAGHMAIVDALIQASADVDVQAQNGATALHNAAGGGFDSVVKALLAANADIDVQNTNCNTALHLAAGKGHLAVVNLALEAGADALIRNAKGWAPAHSAAAGGHLDIVLRLVAAGACPRSKPELDVLRMLARKTSYKLSYVEGRLKLAEKERQRALKAKEAVPEDGVSQEELAALNAKADANMAALLQEEAALKDAQEAKKGKKKKGKKKKGEDRAPEEGDSPPDASSPDAHQSSLQTGKGDADLQLDLPPEEALAEPKVPSKLAQHRNQDKLSRADSATVIKSSTGVDAPQARGKEAGNAAAPLRQKDENGSAALLSSDSARVDSAKVPRSPQRNHVRGAGRRAANVPPAGNAGTKVEWIAVPGQHNALEQNAEWQAAGGRKAKRSTAGKANGSMPPQPTPEPAPARQARLPKPCKPSKGAQPDSQASPHSRASESTLKPAAAPSLSSRDEQPVPQQTSQAAAKGKASTGNTAKAAHAEGKRVSPTKAARDLALAPEQQAGASESEGSHYPAGSTLSFADMARPARTASFGGQAPSAAPDTFASPSRAHEGRPGQSSAPVACPVPASQGHVTKPRAPTVIPGPRLSATVEATLRPQPRRLDKHRAAAPEPVRAAEGQLVQDSQAGGSRRQSVQSASGVSFSTSPTVCSSAPGPYEALPSRPVRADPITINPGATDRLQKAPGPKRVQPHDSSVSQEHSRAPSLFSNMENGHVDWSFPRQGSYGSLSSAAHMPRGHGNAAEGTSERQTFSSVESLGSLTATDGLEHIAASHNHQASRAPLGVSPLGKPEGAGYAASRMANGSVGYPQHLQGGLPGVPSLLHSIWNAAPAWDVSGQQAAQHLPSKPAHRQPGTQMSSAERKMIQHLAEQYGLTCPLTKRLMRDPVMAADGYTYERSAIMQHLSSSMCSPVTHAPMPSKHLDDALAMRSRIALLIPDA